MKQKKYFYSVLLLLFFCSAKGQKIVSVEFKTSVSQNIFQAFISTFSSDIKTLNGVEIYKITYTTTGSDMKPDTASGLMILPDAITGALPILNYQHGTTDGKSDVPSNLSGQEYLLASIFASLGFVTFAPDYIGMGESRGFHPYVHAGTEASAMIDMLSAIKEYMDENEIAYTDQLFITGYSQGGHAAMAAHKAIEEMNGDLSVTASLPMSGPYFISGVMKEILDSEIEYYFPSYLVYSTLGIRAIYPELFDDLNEVFRSDFVDIIRPFSETGENLGAMNVQLLNQLESKFGGSFPKFIFTDSVLTILNEQPDHLFNRALRESDVYDWTPEAPVLMLYCESDDQVPFRNSVIADSVMNERGALDVNAIDVSGGANLSHSDCIIPALLEGIPWLLSFLDSSTPTEDLLDNQNFKIFPNPVSNRLNIESTDDEIQSIELYSLSGTLLFQKIDEGYQYNIDASQFQNGMHILKIATEKGVLFEKIIIEN